jgi:hypothetical protein
MPFRAKRVRKIPEAFKGSVFAVQRTKRWIGVLIKIPLLLGKSLALVGLKHKRAKNF